MFAREVPLVRLALGRKWLARARSNPRQSDVIRGHPFLLRTTPFGSVRTLYPPIQPHDPLKTLKTQAYSYQLSAPASPCVPMKVAHHPCSEQLQPNDLPREDHGPGQLFPD